MGKVEASSQRLFSGKVLIIALIYATNFCNVNQLDAIYIQDPTPEARHLYQSYGFARIWDDGDKMSAEVFEVLQRIQERINAIDC